METESLMTMCYLCLCVLLIINWIQRSCLHNKSWALRETDIDLFDKSLKTVMTPNTDLEKGRLFKEQHWDFAQQMFSSFSLLGRLLWSTSPPPMKCCHFQAGLQFDKLPGNSPFENEKLTLILTAVESGNRGKGSDEQTVLYTEWWKRPGYNNFFVFQKHKICKICVLN